MELHDQENVRIFSHTNMSYLTEQTRRYSAELIWGCLGFVL